MKDTFTPYGSGLTAHFLILGLLILGCSQKIVSEPQYIPTADLLDIVRDFHRFMREDPYRFPIPKDVTGTNIMKATLIRLDDYETKNPGKFSDIIQFTKALSYERLREYDRALAFYRKVAESNGRLGAQAAKNIEPLEDFLKILQINLSAQDPFEYIKGLDEKVGAWNQLIRRYQGTAYEHLARVEEERIDRAKVAFVEVNRHRLKDGNQLVILGYGQLVTKHRQSKHLHRYLLDFGDFYTLLAKEYASQHDPEGLAFDPKVFDELAKSALRLYTEVAQVDGILEKIEAKAKTEALRGLMENVKRLNR